VRQTVDVWSSAFPARSVGAVSSNKDGVASGEFLAVDGVPVQREVEDTRSAQLEHTEPRRGREVLSPLVGLEPDLVAPQGVASGVEGRTGATHNTQRSVEGDLLVVGTA
jgi:hypothetical protein